MDKLPPLKHKPPAEIDNALELYVSALGDVLWHSRYASRRFSFLLPDLQLELLERHHEDFTRLGELHSQLHQLYETLDQYLNHPSDE